MTSLKVRRRATMVPVTSVTTRLLLAVMVVAALADCTGAFPVEVNNPGGNTRSIVRRNTPECANNPAVVKYSVSNGRKMLLTPNTTLYLDLTEKVKLELCVRNLVKNYMVTLNGHLKEPNTPCRHILLDASMKVTFAYKEQTGCGRNGSFTVNVVGKQKPSVKSRRDVKKREKDDNPPGVGEPTTQPDNGMDKQTVKDEGISLLVVGAIAAATAFLILLAGMSGVMVCAVRETKNERVLRRMWQPYLPHQAWRVRQEG